MLLCKIWFRLDLTFEYIWLNFITNVRLMRQLRTHSPFELMYGCQPSTPADRLLLPMVGATADAADTLTLIANILDVVN